jgi:Na+/phosphate symporter
LAEPVKEHIDNNFNPLSGIQKEDFGGIAPVIVSFLNRCAEMIQKNDYLGFDILITESASLGNQLITLKKRELKRIQGQNSSTKTSLVYLNMIHESQNIVSFATNLLKVSRKFQKE